MSPARLAPRLSLVVAALALAACANPNLPGGAGSGAAPGGVASAGAGALPPADSPAYFESEVGDRVLFAVDQHTLSAEARQVLNGQAEWLAANPDYAAVIEGHADEQGTREYNLALSNRRANSVQEYLISRGVAGTRLRSVGYGKERPLAICSDESCYAQNRRAVTVLRASGGAGS